MLLKDLIEKTLQEPEAAKILYKTFEKLLGLASCWDSLDDEDVIRILEDEITSSQID